MESKVIALVIIFMFIGFSVGYVYGFISAVEWGLKKVSHFVELDFDEEQIAYAVWQYKNNINQCYEDAFVYNDTRS